MKKQGWLIFLTIGLTVVLVFCLYVQQRSESEEKPIPVLSFRVFSDKAPEASEEILCWNQDDERCFVFLPSYADLNKTEVQLHSSSDYLLGGVQLTQGMTCGSFSLDTDYELTGEGIVNKTLRFVQSANVATMYIDTFSGSMERVHTDKSYRERVTTTVYTANGQVDYQGYDSIRGRGTSTKHVLQFTCSIGVYTIISDMYPADSNPVKKLADENWQIDIRDLDRLENACRTGCCFRWS